MWFLGVLAYLVFSLSLQAYLTLHLLPPRPESSSFSFGSAWLFYPVAVDAMKKKEPGQ